MIRTILYIVGIILYIAGAIYTAILLKPTEDDFDQIVVGFLAAHWPITLVVKFLIEE